MIPRVLSIAGTDPTGGAGVQADLKSIAAFGGYGMAAVTALVAQNTCGVRDVHAPPAAFLRTQLDAVSDDVEIDAVKIGMLHSVEVVETIEDWLVRTDPPLVVLDPVMVATSGDRLLDAEAESALRRLCRRADLVTPNLAELAVLTGRPPAATWEQAVNDAEALARDAGTAVLLKGGHLAGEDCPDAIVTTQGVHEVPGRRVATTHTHGTGCSMSSAMATVAAHGASWPDALGRVKEWLTGALRHADALRVGRGNGPIDHFHHQRPASAEAWSATAWRAAADIRHRIDGCRFVRGLLDGTLPGETFARYEAQDALYLAEYARLLQRASALAGSPADAAFWAGSAETAVAAEQAMHRRHGAREVAPAPQTTAYLAHLARSASAYSELVAALLPCFVVYADLGARFGGNRHPEHPYDDWLRMYGDTAFARATASAGAIADAAARAADDAGRARMHVAYARSTEHELDFFDRA